MTSDERSRKVQSPKNRQIWLHCFRWTFKKTLPLNCHHRSSQVATCLLVFISLISVYFDLKLPSFSHVAGTYILIRLANCFSVSSSFLFSLSLSLSICLSLSLCLSVCGPIFTTSFCVFLCLYLSLSIAPFSRIIRLEVLHQKTSFSDWTRWIVWRLELTASPFSPSLLFLPFFYSVFCPAFTPPLPCPLGPKSSVFASKRLRRQISRTKSKL